MSQYIENKLISYEGMPLEPPHLQQFERNLKWFAHHKQTAFNNHYWGFSELSLDTSLLSLNKIGIQSATGSFQDGTVFSFPHIDLFPRSFEIVDGMQNITLYLCLPTKQSSIAEVGDDNSEELVRYHVRTQTIRDEILGAEESSEIQVGTLACQIRSDLDDLSDFCVLPIARILEARSHQSITFDKTFLPPCLDVSVTDSLHKFVEEVHGLLNHRAQMLSERLTDTQQAGTSEIVDFMLLQLANRYEPLFHHLSHEKPLHPKTLFTNLSQLLGEMSTYTNSTKRCQEIPVYNHDNLFDTFKPVISELRQALTMVLEQNATAIRLEQQAQGLWVGQINDKTILKESTFIMTVYADLPRESVRETFPAHVKISTAEKIRNLVSRALSGISVSPLPVAPRQIPYRSTFNYFSLDMKNDLWTEMEKSAGIAIHIGHNYPGLKLELWAIRS